MRQAKCLLKLYTTRFLLQHTHVATHSQARVNSMIQGLEYMAKAGCSSHLAFRLLEAPMSLSLLSCPLPPSRCPLRSKLKMGKLDTCRSSTLS